MAESVVINGTTYADVPEVQIPKSDGQGDVSFFLTDGDTAVAGDVLNGKTFHTDGGSATGTMANNGAVTGDISTVNGSVTVAAGYTTGGTIAIAAAEQAKIVSGNVKAGITMLGVQGKSTVVDTELNSDAATAATIAQGKKAFVNGSELTGTLTTVIVAQDSTTKILTIS